MESMVGNRGIAFYLFLFIFAVYLFTAQGNNVYFSDQQEVRFETTRSTVEEGDLSVPDGMGVKGDDGKDYSWYGIGQSLLAIPFFIIGKHLGGEVGAQGMVSLLNLFVVAASGVVVFVFINNLGYSKKTALAVTVFYAFGTLAWPQSKHPFDHPVEELFVLLAIFYAQGYVNGGRTTYLISSAASLGFAFITRVPAVLSLAPIFLLLSYRHLEGGYTAKRVSSAIRDCSIYSLALAPFVLMQFWYNYARFDSIFETGITLMAQKAGIDFFAGTPFITGLSGFLISPGKGFLYYSPISILFFFSIRGFYRRHRGLTLCILGIIASYLAFLSRNIYWHGDWSWGPRYLFAITPLVMLPVADFVERVFEIGKKFLIYSILALFAISMAVQVIGVSVDFNRYFTSLQVEKGVPFTIVGGNGVPYIREPTSGTHFEWDKSPIAYQAASALKIWEGLKEYKFIAEPEKIYTPQEALESSLWFNTFDFWWLRALYTGAPPYLILSALVILSFIIIFSWIKLLRLVRI